MLRTPLTVLPLMVALAATLPHAATAQDPDPWTQPVTLHATEKPLEDALSEIGSRSRIKIGMTPEVRAAIARTRVNAHLDDVPVRLAIQSLVRIAIVDGKQLTARFDGNLCTIDFAKGGGMVRRAAPPDDRSPDRRLVTFSATNGTVLGAVTDVLDKMKTGYRIHPAAREAMNVRLPRVFVENAELRSVLGSLIENAQRPNARVTWWYEPDSGYYVFVPEPVIEHPALSDATVTFRATRETVTDALRRLFDSAGASYAFSPQVLGEGGVEVQLGNVPLEAAIRRVLRSGHVQEEVLPEESGGVFAVGLHPLRPDQVPPKPTYTAHFHSADIRYALRALFSASGENYTLDSHVFGTVTTAFQNLPLRAALELVLKNAKSPLTLTYRLDGNAYRIYPNKDWENWK